MIDARTGRTQVSIDAIAELFDQEAAAEEHLRKIRAQLDEAISQYARANGRAFMRKESVRSEIGHD